MGRAGVAALSLISVIIIYALLYGGGQQEG